MCRIFDLFRQPASAAGGDSRGPIAFVAMELLEGETLAEFLRRQPRLSVDEARPIALQIADGLGAAHSAGVLHRDFKPGNVLLVPGAKGVRAVITDFGLALRSNAEVSLGASVTGTGEVLGTPAYRGRRGSLRLQIHLCCRNQQQRKNERHHQGEFLLGIHSLPPFGLRI